MSNLNLPANVQAALAGGNVSQMGSRSNKSSADQYTNIRLPYKVTKNGVETIKYTQIGAFALDSSKPSHKRMQQDLAKLESDPKKLVKYLAAVLATCEIEIKVPGEVTETSPEDIMLPDLDKL